jgi:hypothetical protein
MSDDLKKFKQFDAKLEWPVRILFTIAIVYCDLRMGFRELYYPDICFGLTLIALWFYFFKIRIISIGILLLLIFTAWAHEPYW